jgi:hypothetical protein
MQSLNQSLNMNLLGYFKHSLFIDKINIKRENSRKKLKAKK